MRSPITPPVISDPVRLARSVFRDVPKTFHRTPNMLKSQFEVDRRSKYKKKNEKREK